MANKQNSNFLFKATDVAEHLKGLYATGAEDWYKMAVKFGWDKANVVSKGSSTTKWINVYYTNSEGVSAPLAFRTYAETHVGQIRPLTEAAAAEMNAASKGLSLIEPRPGNPSVQVQKWSAKVETAADGITVLTDASGNPIVPGDDKLSPMFVVMDLVSKAFAAECAERTARGEAIVAESKRKGVTAAAVAAAAPAGAFLTPEQVTVIRKAFPAKADADAVTAGAIVGKLTVITPIQEAISANAKKNAGAILPNPFARVTLKFDQSTGLPQNVQIYDMSKSSQAGGRTIYEFATVDGEPVNADNVHKFILPRSVFDGIIKMDSVCFSQMGISMPTSFKALVVRQPVVGSSSSLDALYDDDTGSPAAGASTGAPSGATTSAPSGAPTAASSASSADEYDALLDELNQ